MYISRLIKCEVSWNINKLIHINLQLADKYKEVDLYKLIYHRSKEREEKIVKNKYGR